jgi:hypothetical protein
MPMAGAVAGRNELGFFPARQQLRVSSPATSIFSACADD